MRLAGLTLERYGPFERLELPLDPAPGRVNLVVAPNGYGKSVIRAAIGDLLFGIPERTPMDFRHGTERMRLTADLAECGGARTLVRRKGRGNTLADADGVAVAPDETRRLLGGADETVFRELFGLDTALLRSGGQELIRSQGRLGQVLFAAGGGMGRVRELLATLERQRDEFGKAGARHKSRPLWKALSDLEQAQADFGRAALRPDGWHKLELAARETAERLSALMAEHTAGISELAGLRLTGAVRPWLARLEQARATLAASPDTPELEAGFEPRWRAALAAGVQSASAAEAAEAALAAARAAREAIVVDEAWLAAEAEIDALAEPRGRAQGAEADLPGVHATLAEHQARSARLRRDLGWGAAVALPPAPAVKDVMRRWRAHPALAAAAEAAGQARAEAERRLARTGEELSALPEAADGAALADLAAMLRADGDPGVRLEAARRRLRVAEAALTDALAAIPDRRLAEAALCTTVAPSDPVLDAADAALGRAEAAQIQAVRDHATCLAQIDQATAELKTLTLVAALPAPEELGSTRASRDALWARLRGPPTVAPEPATADALDRAIRAADAVADAMIAHGRETAQAASLRERLAELGSARGKAEDMVTDAAGALAKARAELEAIAAAAGTDGRSVPALRTFLRARSDAVARHGERAAAAAELADTHAWLTTLGERLAKVLDVPPPPPEALGALLAEADRRIEAARRLADRRATLESLAAEQRDALALRSEAAERTVRALADWEGGWADVARDLARPADEAPAATSEAMALIEELRTVERERDEAERRVADMHAAIVLLADRVAGAARLSPDLGALPPIEASLALDRRLRAELLAARRRQDADARIAAALEDAARAREAAATAARALAGLRAALRADTDGAAEIQLRLAREAAAARADRAEALGELARQGGGLTVEALGARAAETTPEADAARIGAIAERQAGLVEAIEAAREACRRAEAARDLAGQGTDAADAAQRREAARAALARTAEDALVLHAAHALLQTALDRQAAGADQPLLARIGAVFRAITGGAHAGVAVEETRAGQTMVALEADGITRKPLDQLSEGTSDQLYLALRIAALEEYAASAPPLPFIADDVLQTFDDPRTTATLDALLGLSAHVQVIALTHHPHVGALAAALPAGAVNVVLLGA